MLRMGLYVGVALLALGVTISVLLVVWLGTKLWRRRRGDSYPWLGSLGLGVGARAADSWAEVESAPLLEDQGSRTHPESTARSGREILNLLHQEAILGCGDWRMARSFRRGLRGEESNGDEDDGELEPTQSYYPRLIGGWTPQDVYPEVADLFRLPDQDSTPQPYVHDINPGPPIPRRRKPIRFSHHKASSKADVFEQKVNIPDPDSSDSESTFTYESNPQEQRPHHSRHSHSYTPSMISIASLVQPRNTDEAQGDAFHPDTSGPRAINPWAVEFRPNPVIFSHLRDDSATNARPTLRFHDNATAYTINSIITTPLDDICMEGLPPTQQENRIANSPPGSKATHTFPSMESKDGCTRVVEEVESSPKSASTSENADDSNLSTPRSSVVSLSDNAQVSETPKPFGSSDPTARYDAEEENGCSEQRPCANCPGVFPSADAYRYGLFITLI